MVACEAGFEHVVDERDRLVAEDRPRALGGAARQVLDDQARHQQRLEALAEPVGEKTPDPEAAVEEIGDPEREREGERRIGGALVAEPPAAPRALDQRLGVAHQRLERGGRSGAARQRLEDQHPFLVAERDQRDRQPRALGQLAVPVRIAGAFRPSPRPHRA